MEKTALITGGTDGIGKATARKLLREGWEVVVVGRNPQRCDATVRELKSEINTGEITAITADLSLLSETKKACDTFLRSHERLDFLFLNANAIAQTRILTSEGFEANFALGYLSRVLMTRSLEGILNQTPGAQAMTVVGLNVTRVNFDDLDMATNFTSQEALGRWQWAIQVFTSEFNRKSTAPMNIYIPGLVRTKILANEPQPMRTIVKIMNLVIGISVERAADNVYSVMGDVSRTGKKGVTYAWRRQRDSLDLKLLPGDAQRLSDLTQELLRPYLA